MKKNKSPAVLLNKRGAYLMERRVVQTPGSGTRGGVHRNRKKQLSRNFCRKS